MRISVIGDANSPHVLSRTRAFARRGHKVTLLSETPGKAEELEIISPLKAGPRFVGTFSQLSRLVTLMWRSRADIYHVHYATGYGAWLSAALDLRPLVVSVMGGDVLPDEQAPQSALARWLTRRLLLTADLVTSKSSHLTNRLLAMGVDPKRIMTLLWGVDLTVFHRQDAQSIRHRLGILADAQVVLSPRSVTPFYNIHLILAGFANALRRHPNAVLVVVGHRIDPVYQAELAHQAAELGISENVRFVGNVPADEMPRLYSLASISVNMPCSDGMPQSIMEAMACGTPNLVGALTRYEELIRHGESAWFVAIDPQKIGDAISQLLGDSVLRQRLTEAGLAVTRDRADLVRDVERVETSMMAIVEDGRFSRFVPRRYPRVGVLAAVVLMVIELGALRRKRTTQLIPMRGRER